MLSKDEYRQLGEQLLNVRWHALPHVHENTLDGVIHLAWDMNKDGVVTISDVWMWFDWALGLIGDYVFIAIFKFVPALASFLELGPNYLGGWISWAITIWIVFFLLWRTAEFAYDIRKNGL